MTGIVPQLGVQRQSKLDELIHNLLDFAMQGAIDTSRFTYDYETRRLQLTNEIIEKILHISKQRRVSDNREFCNQRIVMRRMNKHIER